MKKQLQLASKFLDKIGGGYSYVQLKKYIIKNAEVKNTLNQLIGLTADNGFTVTIPIEYTKEELQEHYCYTYHTLTSVLGGNGYGAIDLKNGTVISPRGQEVRLTKAFSKFKESVLEHGFYNAMCRELEISDNKFESVAPRLGEIANTSKHELFITSSIAEFMMVNDNSSYTSCYKHFLVERSTSYWTGTLSYGCDPFTLLVGIRRIKDKFKTGRSWLWVFPDGKDTGDNDFGTPFMIQPKSYGEFNSAHRKVVRKFIQEKINADATWIMSKSDSYSGIYETHQYGYIDNYSLTTSWIKGFEKPQRVQIDFENNLWCLSCGCREDLTDGTGQCDDCSNEYVAHCDNCGDGIEHEDDVYYGPDGDGCYCRYCWEREFTTCDHCNETVSRDDVRDVITIRNGREVSETICEYCSDTYTYCEHCSTYVSDELIVETVDDDVICTHCAEGTCDGCGLHFAPDSDSTDLPDGRAYCSECAEECIKFCAVCGENFHEDDLNEDDICKSCEAKQHSSESDPETQQEAA